MKKHFALLIGRFQPLHIGHVKMIVEALKHSDNIIIGIGSAQEANTYKNPLSYEYRKHLIKKVFPDALVIPILDRGLGNNSSWGEYVLATVKEQLGLTPDLIVTGEEERRTSWFNNIEQLVIPKYYDISATKIRDLLVENKFENWRLYTPSEIWNEYETIRETVVNSINNKETKSI